MFTMLQILSVAPKIDTTNIPTTAATQGRLDAIMAIVFGVLGTIAVLMIVIGGIRYIMAKGNPSDLSQAKNTIIYSLVGLVITILAYAIVAFVIRTI
jgi:hypothetical protein